MKRLLSWGLALLLLTAAVTQAQETDTSQPIFSASGFAVEPYLLDVTTEGATVAFHLLRPMAASVRVYDGTNARTFPSPEPKRAHFVRVTGLAAGRGYRYEVVCGNGDIGTSPDDPSFEIRTAGRPGESFTFAVYGDPRPGDTGTHRHHKDVISQILLSEPAFCLVLGDMVDDGQEREQWEDFFRIESRLLRRAAIYPVMGDNDYAHGRGLCAQYFPQLAQGYYHFQWGGVHFFGLRAWDTRGEQPSAEIGAQSAQVRWLQAELSKEAVQRAPFRVVFLHDPVYICRGRSSEVLRRLWAPIFWKYRVDIVWASWHMYERLNHDGVRYIISGGAGAELIWMSKNHAFPSQAEARRHHYCRVDVSAGAMTIRPIAVDGTVLDSMTLSPRGHDSKTFNSIERAARRLRSEITIAGGMDVSEIPIHLFSYDCGYCRKLLGQDLPGWARENGVSMRVFYYDLAKRGTYDLLMAAGTDFGRQGTDIPTVFVGRTVLGGEREIHDGLPRELRRFRKDPGLYRDQMFFPFKQAHDTKTMREDAFRALGVGGGPGLGSWMA